MRIIKEFLQYDILDQIIMRIESIFPNVLMRGSYLYASSIVDRSGNPVVRIDSKRPLKALLLKFGDKSIEIKSIVNSETESGLSNKIMDVFLDVLPDGYMIIVDQDVSGGFWDHVIQKYKQFNWQKR